MLIPIFKKGDPSATTNYIGIALESIMAKVYNLLLLERIYIPLDPLLRPNQNGSRRLRSTAQHVLTLRRIIEEIKSSPMGKIIFVFIDFSKAYDSIDWNYIEQILFAYHIPSEIINAIMSMYYGAKTSIRINGIFSNLIELGVGVLQGDTLAPFLFIIVLNWILRNATPDDSTDGFHFQIGKKNQYSLRSSSCTSTDKYLSDLEFVDDIALMSGCIDNSKSDDEIVNNIQNMFNRVQYWAKKVGLNINIPKTKFMIVGKWSITKDISQKNIHITCDNKDIEEVLDFKYLGSYLMCSLADFNARNGIAWSVIKKLDFIWKSKIFNRNIKILYFTALIESLLFYNSTTWTINSNFEKTIEIAYHKLLRYALNINWTDKISNKDAFKGLETVQAKLRRFRLSFAGHCERCTNNQPIQTFLFWKINSSTNTLGSLYCANKQYHYYDCLLEDTNISNIPALRNRMNNRKRWSSYVYKNDGLLYMPKNISKKNKSINLKNVIVIS